jgi:hypothetical protein
MGPPETSRVLSEMTLKYADGLRWPLFPVGTDGRRSRPAEAAS